jgi:predicted restriction endonuclease
MAELSDLYRHQVEALQKQVQSLQAQNESLRAQLRGERRGVDFRDEEIEKIVKAILDHHELIIGITDKVNAAIISRLKNLISND